jgi:hypothetical protein
MVAPVPFLTNTCRETLPSQLDGLPEVLDGLVELPLRQRDEPEVVVPFGVSIEAIDEETEYRRGPLVLTTLIQAGRVLLGVGRYVATLQSKPPVERVIPITSQTVV